MKNCRLLLYIIIFTTTFASFQGEVATNFSSPSLKLIGHKQGATAKRSANHTIRHKIGQNLKQFKKWITENPKLFAALVGSVLVATTVGIYVALKTKKSVDGPVQKQAWTNFYEIEHVDIKSLPCEVIVDRAQPYKDTDMWVTKATSLYYDNDQQVIPKEFKEISYYAVKYVPGAVGGFSFLFYQRPGTPIFTSCPESYKISAFRENVEIQSLSSSYTVKAALAFKTGDNAPCWVALAVPTQQPEESYWWSGHVVTFVRKFSYHFSQPIKEMFPQFAGSERQKDLLDLPLDETAGNFYITAKDNNTRLYFVVPKDYALDTTSTKKFIVESHWACLYRIKA